MSQKVLIGSLMFFTMINPNQTHAQVSAGYPCVNQAGAITTRAADTLDDILACIGGVWKSMVYGSPMGAIMPFNALECPAGWVAVPELAGRTIIGAGQGAGLTNRAAGGMGGEEKHTMTEAELAPHTHGFGFTWQDRDRFRGYEYPTSYWPAGGTLTGATQSAGAGQPFDVMMPWVALIYCLKQ